MRHDLCLTLVVQGISASRWYSGYFEKACKQKSMPQVNYGAHMANLGVTPQRSRLVLCATLAALPNTPHAGVSRAEARLVLRPKGPNTAAASRRVVLMDEKIHQAVLLRFHPLPRGRRDEAASSRSNTSHSSAQCKCRSKQTSKKNHEFSQYHQQQLSSTFHHAEKVKG